MPSKIIQIGNSKGIRIPAKTLEKCGIVDNILIDLVDNIIIIRPVKKFPREKWNEKFFEMKKNGDDNLVIKESLDPKDGQWEW
ncbi:MAG: AbrB/MazE/SpoVT family DNA-binding domain-containing protein [bacterium]